MSDGIETLESAEATKKNNPWLAVAIVAGVVLCCCLVMFVGIPTVFALFGPAVRNVFSDAIEELGTPVPGTRFLKSLHVHHGLGFLVKG